MTPATPETDANHAMRRYRAATTESCKNIASAVMIIAGAGLICVSLATPAKALLGQYLLEYAWNKVRDGRLSVDNAQPWPGADIAPIGRLRFPGLDVERVILNQASGEAMAWGPGHVTGTAPLGAPGLSAAAAHRDTHFALLKDLASGDIIQLETIGGETARYRMFHSSVVDVRDWRFPAIFDGPDILALATCWPFDSLVPGPERYVVFAERI